MTRWGDSVPPQGPVSHLEDGGVDQGMSVMLQPTSGSKIFLVMISAMIDRGTITIIVTPSRA